MLSDPNYQGVWCYQCHSERSLTDCHYGKRCARVICKDCAKTCAICNLSVCEECETRTFHEGICDDCYESLPEDIVLTPADVLGLQRHTNLRALLFYHFARWGNEHPNADIDPRKTRQLSPERLPQ